MSGAGGNFAQLGVSKETTWGTRVVPARFFEFTSESLKQEIQRLESAGLRGRRVRHTDQWAAGGIRVIGGINFELWDVGFGLILEQMFGSVATAGAGPYTHTFTPGDLPAGMTIQVGRPDASGTVRPFDYLGCRLASWELSLVPGEIAKLETQWVGKSEDTAQSLASASYGSGDLLTFVGASVTIGGSQVDLKELTITGENTLVDDRWRLQGSANIKQPLEDGLRAYGGSMVADFEDLTQYNRFVNGTEAAVVATLADASGTHNLEFTMNVRFDGETPEVSGPEMLEQPLPFVCIASGAADSTAIQAVYTTSDATP